VVGLQNLLQTWIKAFAGLESLAFSNDPLRDVKALFYSREGWRCQTLLAVRWGLTALSVVSD